MQNTTQSKRVIEMPTGSERSRIMAGVKRIWFPSPSTIKVQPIKDEDAIPQGLMGKVWNKE